ncbi:hypothetical protein [Kineosporia babensis]|uniref:Uncharacterized protein n=1 Tax=Kineosporia babensis TaxID=499548 RepID=A0A9X1NAC3_9ACTN|nr:hypothetical protein [Kineosporia babensis]MCD5311522.1 hypothetical protein [Kineosporia babensis]
MEHHRHLDPAALAAGLPKEWAEDARLALTALQEALTAEEDGSSCPVCVGVAAVCDHGPVLLDRVAEMASGLARTLREMAPENQDESDVSGIEDHSRGTAPTRRPPPPTTVPINVSD